MKHCLALIIIGLLAIALSSLFIWLSGDLFDPSPIEIWCCVIGVILTIGGIILILFGAILWPSVKHKYW